MIWAIAMALWITLLVGARLAMSRDVLRCVLGLSIIGSGVNLFLFSSGRITTALPAVVPAGATTLGESANPLPQALVLTAIVIGFALVCFSLVLALRLIRDADSDNTLDLRFAEPVATHPVEPPPTPHAFEPAHPEAHPGASPQLKVERRRGTGAAVVLDQRGRS